MKHSPVRLVWLVWISFALAACAGAKQEEDAPFRPPTQAVVLSPLAQAAASPTPDQTQTAEAAARPTATPACSNNLTFLSDLTIPDGSLVGPGAALDKRWQVENSGTCNWDERYRLKLLDGVEMSAPVEQALYPARSGSELTIQILFTAPQEAGIYRSAWQAYDPDGLAFGDPVFIEVTVDLSVSAP